MLDDRKKPLREIPATRDVIGTLGEFTTDEWQETADQAEDLGELHADHLEQRAGDESVWFRPDPDAQAAD